MLRHEAVSALEQGTPTVACTQKQLEGCWTDLGLQQEVVPLTDCPGSLLDFEVALMTLDGLFCNLDGIIQHLNPLVFV